ncbi:MAG TPA: D-arabinono-1,4-lactone oxidase [Naasia sp.]|jgi:xylitol oxidase
MTTADVETNWSGNLVYSAARSVAPRSVEELQEAVEGASAVKARGSRHSFTDIADTTGLAVDTAALPAPFEVSADRTSVRIGGGARYGEVAAALAAEGLALANLASLPHISVAGAVATGTHGSGVRNRSLSAAVRGIELVDGRGELRSFLRGRDAEFEGAVVNLGALGIVTALELDVEPAYEVRQTVYEDLPWEALQANPADVFGAGYSVSLFTDWVSPTVGQVWVKQRTDEQAAPPDLFGALPATRDRHPLPELGAENCTLQLGVPGPWHERLPHFRLEFTPSAGEELQSEYLLPREHALDAIAALRALGPAIAPRLFVTEIRTVAADELWLSPAYGRDSVALHFTWHRDPKGVGALLPELERSLAPFDPRPHWGKVFDATQVAGRYPRAEQFLDLRGRLDPHGLFLNAFLRRTLIP